MVALLPFAIAGVSQGLSLFGKSQQAKAQRQYEEQAYQFQIKKSLSDYEYNTRQSQAQYQQQVNQIQTNWLEQSIRYSQDYAYTWGLRKYEAQQRANNAQAGQLLYDQSFKAFERDSQALQQRFTEDDAVQAMQYQAAKLEGLKARSSFNAKAAGRAGPSIDRLANTFNVAMGDVLKQFVTARAANADAYRNSAKNLEYTLEGRLNQWAPYTEQEYMDPWKPLTPNYPTYLAPTYNAPERMASSAQGVGFLDLLGAGIGGFLQYQSYMPGGLKIG